MEVDRIPLSQLPSRYSIARSALYTRLKDLNIQPEKQGKKAFVSAEQLQRLDNLHEHIQRGGTTGEFLKQSQRGQSQMEEVAMPFSGSPGQMPLAQPGVFVAVVEAIVKRLVPAAGSRLSYLRELEEAYEKGWLLSTSEVASLLKLSSKTVCAYGEEFEDAGFVFIRAGVRKGGEIAWAVDKKPLAEAITPSLPGGIGVKEAFFDKFDPEAD